MAADLKAVKNSRRPEYCSFCGKNEHEVPKLIAGPSVWICSECVSLADDICREKVVGYSAERAEQIPKLQVTG